MEASRSSGQATAVKQSARGRLGRLLAPSGPPTRPARRRGSRPRARSPEASRRVGRRRSRRRRRRRRPCRRRRRRAGSSPPRTERGSGSGCRPASADGGPDRHRSRSTKIAPSMWPASIGGRARTGRPDTSARRRRRRRRGWPQATPARQEPGTPASSDPPTSPAPSLMATRYLPADGARGGGGSTFARPRRTLPARKPTATSGTTTTAT